ncbi:MAG: glycosyltransferase [Acidimicrobiia bacterium]
MRTNRRPGPLRLSDRGVHRFEEAAIAAADGLVIVSRWMAEDLWRTMPATRGVPHEVVPNFLPDDWAATVASTGPERTLLAIGRLSSWKNQAYLLDVLDAARRRGHSYTLSLAGTGADEDELRRRCHELDLDAQVEFCGVRRDIVSLLKSHRALIHVSRGESFGIVVIEAMAAGRPIFAAPTGAIPETLRDGVEGWYLPLDDADAAAAVLVERLEDDAALASAAEAGRRRFESCYRAGVVGGRLRAFLESLLEDHQ